MLVPNWRRVLLRASSLWCVYLAAALEIAASTTPYVADILPRWLTLAVLVAAPIARIISQGGLDADQQDQAK
jgi:hypothetical protein